MTTDDGCGFALMFTKLLSKHAAVVGLLHYDCKLCDCKLELAADI